MNPDSCWPANPGCCLTSEPWLLLASEPCLLLVSKPWLLIASDIGAIGGPHRDLGFGGAPLGVVCGPHRSPIQNSDGREGADIGLYPPPVPTGFASPRLT